VVGGDIQVILTAIVLMENNFNLRKRKMNKNVIALAISLFVASNVWATSNNENGPHNTTVNTHVSNQSTNHNQNTNLNSIQNTNRNQNTNLNSIQSTNRNQNSVQNTISNQNDAKSFNSAAFNVSSDSNFVDVRQAPAIGMQLGSPTASCMNVVGVGGSGTGGAGLISFSIGVDWCKGFEMARQAYNHNMKNLAEDLICSVDEVKALNSVDCQGARDRAVVPTTTRATVPYTN